MNTLKKLKKLKKSKGFTLLELIVVVSIIAILVVIGVPQMNDLIERNRVKTAANSMNSGIQIARSEAIKRNGTVTFELSNSQWQVMAGNELITLSHNEISDNVTQNTLPNGATSLTFNNMGMLSIGADGLANITRITLEGEKTGYRLWINVTNSGGSRVCNPDDTGNTSSIVGC